ncbi:348_t:CDS:2, partial [Dentiscutata heterogama]
MNWDIKYHKGEFTVDELKTIVQSLNQEQDSKVIMKQNQVYWHHHFPEFKKNYLHDYPRYRELSDYKQELLQQSQLVLSSTTPENTDLLQRNIALISDKEELLRINNELTIRLQELETNNAQLIETNNQITELNNGLKIVLRDAEDERDNYKMSNFAEFNNFVNNYIFGLFNMLAQYQFLNYLVKFINTFNLVLVIRNNNYVQIIYKKFIWPLFAIPYVWLTEYKRVRVAEIIFVNILTAYFIVYLTLYLIFIVFLKSNCCSVAAILKSIQDIIFDEQKCIGFLIEKEIIYRIENCKICNSEIYQENKIYR